MPYWTEKILIKNYANCTVYKKKTEVLIISKNHTFTLPGVYSERKYTPEILGFLMTKELMTKIFVYVWNVYVFVIPFVSHKTLTLYALKS